MPASSFPPVRPALPQNGKELYDSIMSKIEPELISSELPLLEQSMDSKPKDLSVCALTRFCGVSSASSFI